MILVGICGASGSGKSTLAEEIQASLTCDTLILGQDCYYKDHSHLPFHERMRINYDRPDSFDDDELLADIQTLACGQTIPRKGYDYAEHRRADSQEQIAPPDVLILEGIHAFHKEALRAAMSLKVYMHVDTDVCLLRRIQRDIKERGRDIDNIGAQYLNSVKPMYERYISKYIRYADFAVMHGGKNRCAIDAVSAYISAKLLAEAFAKEEAQKTQRISPPEA